MNQKAIIERAMNENRGVLRLRPAWVPRSFCRPGRRLKLHPDDYFALGLSRGGIDERWLASTTKADNGPGTPHDEGLSYIITENGDSALLIDAVSELKGGLIGGALWEKHGRWPAYSKFFDNLGPLPHHVHHDDNFASNVGQKGKPEMYFYPSQMNNYGGEFPFTFFGLNPDVKRGQLIDALRAFTKGDNQLLQLSRAYKLTVDTGWDVPPGLLHAPGSLCTYEPQFSSDVFAMYQSVLYFDHAVPENLLWKDCPEDRIGDFDYLADVLNWELNIDPDFSANRFMSPIPAKPLSETEPEGYIDEWICYKSPAASAKRLTVLPGRSAVVKNSAAYGLICVQGRGKIGAAQIESPSMIRYGQHTRDEYFVAESAAKAGVVFKNESLTEPLVILKHFSENPDLRIT